MRRPLAATGALLALLLIAPLPVGAAGDTLGVGVVTGLVTFSGVGVPPAGQNCIPTSFQFSGTSQPIILSLPAGEYVGSVGVYGSGGSNCENAGFADGSVSVAVVSYVTIVGSGVSCPAMAENYLRVGPNVLLQGSGDCTLNGRFTPGVQLVVDGEFAPSTVGPGVTGPITGAVFAAGFVLLR
jgi:hypothetical protein